MPVTFSEASTTSNTYGGRCKIVFWYCFSEILTRWHVYHLCTVWQTRIPNPFHRRLFFFVSMEFCGLFQLCIPYFGLRPSKSETGHSAAYQTCNSEYLIQYCWASLSSAIEIRSQYDSWPDGEGLTKQQLYNKDSIVDFRKKLENMYPNNGYHRE